MFHDFILLRWMRSLYLSRIPILMAAVLCLLWLFRGGSMVSGLYAADQSSCFLLGFVQTLLGVEIWMLLSLVQLHGEARLAIGTTETGPPPPLTPQRHLAATAVAALPVLLNLFGLAYANGGSHVALYSWTLGGGVATADAALVLTAVIVRRSAAAPKGPNRPEAKLIRRMEPLRGEAAGFLYFHPERKRRVLGDYIGLAAGFAVLSLAAFIAVWWIPANALISVTVWLSLAGWALGFLCFFFDRYRIPTLTVVAVWGFFVGFCPWDSHYYFLSEAPRELAAADVSDLFASNGTAPSRIIVVSAEGGGIHAEAWTARVLAGLAEELQHKRVLPFWSSVRLLSGTSGGSVGNMFVQTLYDDQKRLNNPECWQAIAGATLDRRGLDYVAHGIIHYDLTRPILPSLIGYPKHDRGFALEQAWESILEREAGSANCAIASPRAATMDHLRNGVRTGARPLLVFNATFVDSGWPLAITNFDMKETNGLRVFEKQYENRDLSLLTAVRLSASFPYVVPAPKPLVCAPSEWLCLKNRIPEDRQLAVIDGGLCDNYAVWSAYEALNQATRGFSDFHHSKILWLRIRDSAVDTGTGVASPRDARNPIDASVFGPLYTLFQVRGTGQAVRADELMGRAAIASGNSLLPLSADYKDVDPKTNQTIAPPLSWALTKAQADAIGEVWKRQSPAIVSAACAFLSGRPCD